MKKWILLSMCLSISVRLMAGIMIYPKYLFLDNKTKSAEVTLINSSPLESSNYRISLTYKKQNPDGTYTDISADKAPADSAIPFLRYSPRSVMLSPSKGQTVRLLKRLPADAVPGEYVVYLTFTEVVLEKPATKESLNPNTTRVKITPVPSFSIPVFVRYDVKENAPVALSTQPLEEKGGVLYLPVVMTRQAQKIRTSVRGDLTVWDGDKQIGFIKGRYLLPGSERLQTNIALKANDGKETHSLTSKELKGKTLTILLTEPGENEINTESVFAKTQVTL